MTSAIPAEIAIVGVAAELPSGSWSDTNLDYNTFFRFLRERGEAYERIPIERFNIHTLVGNGLGKCATATGTFLKDVHLFDPLEFGVTSKDARLMPLSTRRLLETSFLSLVDSGIDYRGRNIGCYMAGVAFDMFSVSGHDDDEARGSFAGVPGQVANRVSYHLDLRGPSIPIDTACSASLSATHLAVQAIRNGDCEAAVVGGSQLNHRFSEWLYYTQGGVLSPDGKCKPFDASANGFGRGEGVVCMVLKPLDAALRDGDKVYATILGTGINNCGSLAPVNAPVAVAQQEAMKRAFAQARRDPREVDFLELHTTGTAMGDPTEANWVGELFGRDSDLLLGSVKGNIGHTEIAAFLASLCKVCAIFETGIVPPNANLVVPNPAIKWREFNMRVAVEPERLVVRAPTGRALVAMTSSGIGGANGSCVVQGPPSVIPKPSTFWYDPRDAPLLFVAGGLTPRSSAAVGAEIADKLCSWSGDTHQAAARAYARRARSMTWRSFAVKKGDTMTKFSEPVLARRSLVPTVFVFSGQGPQHYAMGRELFHTCTVFRESILRLDSLYKSIMGHSLVELTGIFDRARPADPLGEIWPISITLVSLTMLQIALFDTLASIGITPDVVVGHSAGETALLYASGSGSAALALELSIARGKAMSLLETENGTMAALSCSPDQAAEVIAAVLAELGPGTLEIACYNTPGAVTLSGHEKHVARAVEKASEAGVLARRLRTRIPVHSAMMEHCAEAYKRLVGDVFARYDVGPTTVETWSTKTGTLLDSAFDAQYYWDSTLGAVRFTDAIEGIAKKHPHAIYVELGPHPVLTSYISAMAGKHAVVVSPLRRPRSTEKRPVEVSSLLEAVGKLVVSGYTRVDWDVLYGTPKTPAGILPPFPLARKDIPYLAPTAEVARQRQRRNGPLNYPQLALNEKTHPDLGEHVIKKEPILSTAAYMEMALEFGARKLYNIDLISILSLSAKRPTPIEVRREGTRWSILSAGQVDYMKAWPVKYNRLHAKGHLCMRAEPEDAHEHRDIVAISDRMTPVEMKGFYDGFCTFADYGPTYQRILECGYSKNAAAENEEWLVKLRGADVDLPDITDYKIHPAILDASLHFLVHPAVTGINDASRYYLPSKIGALVVHDALLNRPFPPIVYAHATFKQWTPDTLTYDLLIMADDGTPLYSVEELQTSMHGQSVPRVERRYEVVYGAIEHDGFSSGSSGSTPSPISSPTTPETGSSDSLDSGFASQEEKRPSNLQHIPQYTVLEPFALPGALHNKLAVSADGIVGVPKIVEAHPPPSQTTFQPSQPWKYDAGRLTQVSLPYSPPGHVLVHVTAATMLEERLWSFVGRTGTEGGSPFVAGVACGPPSNVVVSHQSALVELRGSPEENPALSAVPAAIAILAVGETVFSRPEYLRQMSILVTHSDSALGAEIAQLYRLRGANVFDLPEKYTASQLKNTLSKNVHVIVSGSRDDSEVKTFREMVSRHDKVFLWNDARDGIAAILRNDPHLVGDALRVAVSLSLGCAEAGTLRPPLDLVPSAIPESVPLVTDVFNAGKSYVLHGGAGGLGMRLAHWMYKNGARELLLTSLVGEDGLLAQDEHTAKRYLDYLQDLPGLRIHRVYLEDSPRDRLQNATSEMLQLPVGGCFVLSETHGAKVEAFKLMEEVVAVANLDFFVVFTSASGLLAHEERASASAGDALVGLTKKYRNAVCIAMPEILDAPSVGGELPERPTSWGMTSAEFFTYVEDAIRCVASRPIVHYVPAFDWALVRDNLGVSPLFEHLVPTQCSEDADASSDGAAGDLAEAVCKVLELAREDLTPDVPFTSYGLDSLSAAALSHALRPFLAISQLQLLADVSLRDVEARIASSA